MGEGRAKRLTLVAGPLVAIVMLVFGSPFPGVQGTAWSVAAVTAWMAIWWIAESVPHSVTAILPLVLFPALTIGDLKATASAYAHPLILLMLGGMVLGLGLERSGLHHRLAGFFTRSERVRRRPAAVLAVLMGLTGFFSALVSNTATMLMMLPLALALLDEETQKGRSSFALGLAYASSIGGMATLVGTPPNAIVAGVASEVLGQSIGFAQWLSVGLPVTFVLMPLAWWVLSSMLPLPTEIAGGLERERGPISSREWAVILIVGAAVLAWLTRAEKDLGAVVVPGWERWVEGSGSSLDAWVALVASALLMILPVEKGQPVLPWKRVEQGLPWGILILLGGGFALAGGIASSGLTEWIATQAQGMGQWPGILSLTVLVLSMTFLTELTSNTATSSLVLPVVAVAAVQAGVIPMQWLVPVTFAASCAFMMPVATPPNAIAAGVGVSSGQMRRVGFRLNMMSAVVLVIVGTLWVPLVWGP